MKQSQGTILRVDLSSAHVEHQPFDESFRQDYAGGRGINSRILFDETGPDTDPLGPENRLIFAAGPLSGTAAPCAARFTVTARSPQTGILGDANAGGRFGPALKKAGIDNLVVKGAAADPVYLFIDDDRVEIKSASHLWGKNIRETDTLIKEELGDKNVRIAAIGQAGENLVKIAGILHDDHSASRTGVGAVMGSKKLKAIAVRGTKKVAIADSEKFKKAAKNLTKRIAESPIFDNYRKYAGVAGVAPTNQVGILAVKNFQQLGGFEGIENFNAQMVADRFYEGSRPCFGCPIGCGNQFRVKDGPFAGEWGYKIEEGAYTPLGPVCGNSFIDSIFKMNNMANHYGLDLIEFGQGIAVLMELYEKGIVASSDLDGIEMTWGNYEAMMQMMEKIVFRKGVGDILAEGIVRAAPHFGNDAEKYVSHSKGMVMAGIDPRLYKGIALGFATSTRGADHLRAIMSVEFKGFTKVTPEEAKARFGTTDVLEPLSYNKAAAQIAYQHHTLVGDLLEICRFSNKPDSSDFGLDNLCELYSHATGIQIDVHHMLTVAERVLNVERAYLCREGVSREDDHLIGKWATESVPNGPCKGEVLDPEKWEGMLDDYYRLRGWNTNGVPTRDKLNDMGISDVADSLDNSGAYRE